ncbi:MAG: glycosyltransferase family 2 protein [Firmicutes bacterium]|nr:glycosyltransferase family 2 protein [Bacillota bacterium]
MSTVCAVVVTYNRSATLRRCLTAIEAQTRLPDGLLVVDNASTDDTRDMVAREFPRARVLTLPENLGGAGGFEAGLREALALGYDWAWLTDDDPQPEPVALEAIMSVAERADPTRPAIFSSVQYDPGLDKYNAGFDWRGLPVPVARAKVDRGEPYETDLAPFCGFLAGRPLVEAVGYPRGDFFSRFTDYEYCLRARGRGIPVVIVPTSRMLHPLGERGAARRVISRNPPWKAYYDSRNRVFTALSTRRSGREFLLALRFSALQSARELVVNPRYGVPNTLMRVRGIVDGVRGRMGKTVDPARTRSPGA